MTPVLVFDIETIPDVTGLRRAWGLEGTDLEVVQSAQARRRELTGSDFLSPYLHRVVVISCLFRDDEGLRIRSLASTTGAADAEEGRLLSAFFGIIDRHTPTLVSWNGSGFDLPVMHHRGLFHGLCASRYWETGDEDRDFRYNNYLSRYHTRHTDLMAMLSSHQARAQAPLDEVARLCGFPGKLGMDGSQVWQAWSEGRAEEVRDYCETDVANTWLVYCRFQRMRGLFDAEREAQEHALLRSTLQSLPGEHWQRFLSAWPQA